MSTSGQNPGDPMSAKIAMRNARRIAKPFGISVHFVREEIWVYPPDYLSDDPYRDHHFPNWEAALDAVKQYAKILDEFN